MQHDDEAKLSEPERERRDLHDGASAPLPDDEPATIHKDDVTGGRAIASPIAPAGNNAAAPD